MCGIIVVHLGYVFWRPPPSFLPTLTSVEVHILCMRECEWGLGKCGHGMCRSLLGGGLHSFVAWVNDADLALGMVMWHLSLA